MRRSARRNRKSGFDVREGGHFPDLFGRCCQRSLQNAPAVITSKCTTSDGGFVVDGGVVGKEGMRRWGVFWPAAADRSGRKTVAGVGG